MTLVVEDGSGLENAEAYASVSDADTYATRRSWTDWSAAAGGVKETALIEATRYLDGAYKWKGRLMWPSTPQALNWPRANAYDDEGRPLVGIPEKIKSATIELARMSLSAALVVSETEGAVSSLQAGSVSLTFKDGQTASETAKFKPIDRIVEGLFEIRAGGGNFRISRA